MKLTEYTPGAGKRRAALAVFWTALSVRAVLLLLQLFAGLTIMGTVTTELIHYVVLVSALFCITKRRFALSALIVLLLLFNTVLFLLHNDGAEYRFISPQRTNTLVIREKSALISAGWSKAYHREYGIFLRDLDIRLGTGENYSSYPSGQYHVTWEDEQTVLLTYYAGKGYHNLKIAL